MDDEELLRQRMLGDAKLRELCELFDWMGTDEGKAEMADLYEEMHDEGDSAAEIVRGLSEGAEHFHERLLRDQMQRDHPESN